GILVIKDVTTILAGGRDGRAPVLAALREVYDGRYERNVGSAGGQTLRWEGRIAVVGAVTTVWDSANAVVAVMGDRFVLLRIDSDVGREESGCARSAIPAAKYKCARSWPTPSADSSLMPARKSPPLRSKKPGNWLKRPMS